MTFFQKIFIQLALWEAPNEKISATAVARSLTENNLFPNKENKKHWKLRPKLQINESVIQVQILVNENGPMYMKTNCGLWSPLQALLDLIIAQIPFFIGK